MSPPRTRVAAGLLLAGLWAWGQVPSLQAQEIRSLAEACVGTTAALRSLCTEAAMAAQAAQGGLGLAASQGSEVTGAASTLGWRLKGAPRYSLSVRGSSVRGRLPNLALASASRGGETYTLFAGQVAGSVGVFDGFSPAPTVGGMLSLDLTASAHLISAPKDRGFQDGMLGWGAGARLGLVRESFTLPGVSVSGYYRSLGNNGVGSVAHGAPAEARFDVSVSSFRAIAGKDLWGVGVAGGAGWDRYLGRTVVRAVSGAEVSEAEGDLSSDRFLYFVSGTLTYVVLQASAELGWAQGFSSELPPGSAGGFDPSRGSTFGSLAFRLTF